MDGNGRWAERRGRPRVFGHIRGTARVKEIVRAADQQGIRVLTLFAFSTENWSRPEAELSVLWRLFKKYLQREVAELDRKNVRFSVIGEIDRLSPELQAALNPVIERLHKNTGLQLNLAISYGSRREIARAARLFAEDCLNGKAHPNLLTENESNLDRYLWTGFLEKHSDVDLLIRTSGELRLSNFMLWQAAYSELYFTDLCWPDFTRDELTRALKDYAGRQRRFGALTSSTELAHNG